MTRYRGSVPITDDWQHFRFSVADGVATVTLNRPEKMNPLTFESYADLRDLLHELPHRGDTDVLVIRGEGRGFCGGGDVNEIIGELITMDPRDLIGFTRMTGDVIKAMRECPIPIVTGIQGIAAGAGSVIAIASDFRVCSRSARFAFLFTKVGLSGGDMGAAYLLPRLVGAGRATELLMLGDTIDAETADRYGLVSQLVDDEALDEAVAALARRLADGPTLAFAQTKSLITRELDMPHRGCDGARRDDAGAADDDQRPRRVPRRVQREAPARVDRPVTRVAMVTGASQGIGRACAEALSAAGHRVALVARSEASLREVAGVLPGESLVLPTDVTSPERAGRRFRRGRGGVGTRRGAGRQRRSGDVGPAGADVRRRLAADARPQPHRAVPMPSPRPAVDDVGRVGPGGRDRVDRRQARRRPHRGVHRQQARRPRPGAYGGRRGRAYRSHGQRRVPGLRRHPDDRRRRSRTSRRAPGAAPRTPARSSRDSSRSGAWSTRHEVASAVLLCVDNGAISGQGLNVDGGAVQS